MWKEVRRREEGRRTMFRVQLKAVSELFFTDSFAINKGLVFALKNKISTTSNIYREMR